MVLAEAGVNGHSIQEVDKEGKAVQNIQEFVSELIKIGYSYEKVNNQAAV